MKGLLSNVSVPSFDPTESQQAQVAGIGTALLDNEEERKKRLRGVPAMAKGGKVKSASSRADGCALRGKTRGKIV